MSVDHEHAPIRDEDRPRDEDRARVSETRVEDRPVRVRPERREYETEVRLPEAYNLARDRVRWGPIWAGFFTAMTTMLLLGLLGLAGGLTTVNAGTAAATGGPPAQTGAAAGIWGAVSAIIAFFLGGMVAAWTAAVFDRKWGMWNGLMVFLFGLPIMLWLATQGLSSVLGTVANYGLSFNPGAVQNAAGQAQGAAANSANVAQAAAQLRNGAWMALVGALLGLIAAGLGGIVGTRREVALDRTTSEVTYERR
jgi:hypothetical protein